MARNVALKLAVGTALFGTGAWALTLVAGPLDPPPGPVTATGPTQINQQFVTSFPITIDEPGSYILTGHLTNTAPTNGIVIDADNVLLDLNGFSLSGAGINTTSFRHGIAVLPGRTNARIVNGSITGWKGASSSAVFASHSGTVTLEDIACVDNSEGIRNESHAVLRDCTSVSNDTNGFTNLGHALYIQCTAFGNSQSGFISTFRARYIDCHTVNNDFGFRLANGDAAISRCTSSGDSTGFQQDGGSMFHGLSGTDILGF